MRQVVDPAWRMLTMQPALRERLGTLALTRRLGEDLPPTIRTDATRAMQILVNVAHVFASHAAALPASAVRAASLHSGASCCLLRRSTPGPASLQSEAEAPPLPRSSTMPPSSPSAARSPSRWTGSRSPRTGSASASRTPGGESPRRSRRSSSISSRRRTATRAASSRALGSACPSAEGAAPPAAPVGMLPSPVRAAAAATSPHHDCRHHPPRRLASALGGTLQLYSEGVGRGCQFTLFLPLEPPAPRGEPPMAAVGARGEHHRVFGGESFVAGGSGRMHNGGRGPTVLLPFPEAQQHTTPAQSPPPVEGASARGGGSLAASLSASESSALPAVMADLSCSTSAASAIPATPPSPRRELAETASAAASSTQTAAAEEGASGGPAPEEQQPRPRRRILVAENDRCVASPLAQSLKWRRVCGDCLTLVSGAFSLSV